MGVGTYLVLVGLIIGKPLGITLFTWIAEKGFKLEVPAGMSYRHVVTLGVIAGIGFTVALFVSEAAFPAGAFSDELRRFGENGSSGEFLCGSHRIYRRTSPRHQAVEEWRRGLTADTSVLPKLVCHVLARTRLTLLLFLDPS